MHSIYRLHCSHTNLIRFPTLCIVASVTLNTSRLSVHKRLGFFCNDTCLLDPVHTVPDPYGHDINLNSLKTRAALKFVIILHNLIKTNHRKSGKSEYDRKLTEFDVVTTRIKYRVNGIFVCRAGGEKVPNSLQNI